MVSLFMARIDITPINCCFLGGLDVLRLRKVVPSRLRAAVRMLLGAPTAVEDEVDESHFHMYNTCVKQALYFVAFCQYPKKISGE